MASPSLSLLLPTSSFTISSRLLVGSSSSWHDVVFRQTRLRCRFFSTSGKPRFYRNVSVIPASPPWITTNAATTTTTKQQQQPQLMVQSPISAGVDGTDSASGVIVKSQSSNKKDTRYYREWLIPRKPGTSASSATATTTTSPDNEEENDWFAVCLDGRPLLTPSKSRLVVPSRMLAQMIAAEWDAQSPTLIPAQMPLTTCACTVLDQVVEQPQVYKKAVLQYLPTDTLMFWADPLVDRDLYQQQLTRWTPILKYLQDKVGTEFPTTSADGSVLVVGTNKITQHQKTLLDKLRDKCHAWVDTLDAWHLGILYALTVEAKSFGMALAYLYENNNENSYCEENNWKQLTSFVPACRIEEETQIASWGLVEGGHDYDRLNCSIQIHAAVLMKQCLEYEQLKRQEKRKR